ncbi:MAG: hypothetical protein AMJ43_02970 [Coxiella sp. DG_40]|nr:MAG: hypothetical protein AMJ43_02970 [Coxiella sp. DG_40]
MNKTNLIDVVAQETGEAKTTVSGILDAILNTIVKTLAKSEDVAFVGFGTFTTSKRKARSGRNPRTGATIQIPATVVPKFKAGKELKKAVKK